MAIVFILVALIFIISGVRGETERVTETLKSDVNFGLSSASQFGMWIAVMLVLSAVGSYKPMRPVADAFIVLVLVVFLLRNAGFLPKVVEALK